MRKRCFAVFLLGVLFLSNSLIAGYAQQPGPELYSQNGLCAGSSGEQLFDGELGTSVKLEAKTTSAVTVKAENAVKSVKITMNQERALTKITCAEIRFYSDPEQEPVRIDTLRPSEEGVIQITPNMEGIHYVTVRIAGLAEQTANPLVSISEIDFGEAGADPAAQAEKALTGSFTIVQNTRQMDTNFTLSKIFDGMPTTTGGFARILNARAVLQFNQPVDLTKISLISVMNNDWAMAKRMKLSVYNTDVVYRRMLQYPSPVPAGEFELQQTNAEQELILDAEQCKNVTHLVIEVPEIYPGFQSPWGGFRDIVIYGTASGDARNVADIIATTPVSHTDMLIGMGILSGDGRPATDEAYLNAPLTRIEAALISLKLLGVLEEAMACTSDYNFADSGDVSGYYQNILAYLMAHGEAGIKGVGGGRFAPAEEIRAQDFYRIMLKLLGYTAGEDYTEETMERFLHSLGMGDAFYVKHFDRRDLGCALFEMMMQKPKNEEDVYAVVLNQRGVISDEALALYLDKADALDMITDGEYEPASTIDTSTSFRFAAENRGGEITKAQFGYNTPFQLKGLYYGTLPAEDPRSKREEFAERMKDLGCWMARFPGGTQAHQYIIGSEELTKQLYFDLMEAEPTMSPNYDPTNPIFSWYVDFFNWLEFCCENGIEPLFQCNPYFYYDSEDGRVMALTLNRYVVNPDETIKMPGYYDGDRCDRAAYELGKVIDEMHARGLEIKHWEIGNEDFSRMNYQRTDINSPDNRTAELYAKIAAAYTKVIKEKIPDAVIILTGGMGDNIEAELEKTGEYDKMGPYTAHYPFARWVTPPAGENKNLKRFVYTNDVNFVRDRRNVPHPLVTTEMSVWKYESWDSRTVQSSFANALSTAHNYLEAVFESNWDLITIHDLESPFFGAMPYDVILDPGDRKAKAYVDGDTSPPLVTKLEDIPEENLYIDKYFNYPSAPAFGMISKHLAGVRLTPERSCLDRLISSYASLHDNKIIYTVINRTENDVQIDANFGGFQISSQYAACEYMQSDYLGAIAEEEYTHETTVQKVISEKTDSGSKLTFPLPRYAVMNLELVLDE